MALPKLCKQKNTGMSIMDQNAEKPEPEQSKPDSKPDANGKPKADAKEDLQPGAKPTSKDDLKSIPMDDLQAKLQSSAKGLTQAEAAKRLANDGPNALKRCV